MLFTICLNLSKCDPLPVLLGKIGNTFGSHFECPVEYKGQRLLGSLPGECSHDMPAPIKRLQAQARCLIICLNLPKCDPLLVLHGHTFGSHFEYPAVCSVGACRTLSPRQSTCARSTRAWARAGPRLIARQYGSHTQAGMQACGRGRRVHWHRQ